MTYSILAREQGTGRLGAAVASCNFSVGPRIIAAEPGVGVAAAQSGSEVWHRSMLLDLMRRGNGAGDAMAAFEGLPGAENRQAGLVDVHGRVASSTGLRCEAEVSSASGDAVTAQANLMASAAAAPAMVAAYEAASEEPLAERLLAGLRAALAEGGDLRGQQSAALVVVSGMLGEQQGGLPGEPWLDLRVDDAPRPLDELARQLAGARAQPHLFRAHAEGLCKADWDRVVAESSAGLRLAPEDPGLRTYQFIGLVLSGQTAAARPHLEWLAANVGVAHVRERMTHLPQVYSNEGWPRMLALLDGAACNRVAVQPSTS